VIVTRASSGLNPSTWLASFSINEYWYKLQHTNTSIRIKDKLKQSPSTRTHTCSFNCKNKPCYLSSALICLIKTSYTNSFVRKEKQISPIIQIQYHSQTNSNNRILSSKCPWPQNMSLRIDFGKSYIKAYHFAVFLIKQKLQTNP